MEVDIEKYKTVIEKELVTLSEQLQQIDNQIAHLNQSRNNQVALILKKQGALEFLNILPKD